MNRRFIVKILAYRIFVQPRHTRTERLRFAASRRMRPRDRQKYMAITIALNGSRAARRPALLGPGGPWDARAPRHVKKAYQSSDDRAGWQAWQKHLAERTLKPCARLAPRRHSPLPWEL